MNLEQLQTGILDAISRRDELVTEAREKFIQAAKAKHAFKMAHATAMLKSVDGKNAETRKAQADLAVDKEMFHYEITEAEAEGIKSALYAKADEISALQSLLRMERSEADALRYGQHNQT